MLRWWSRNSAVTTAQIVWLPWSSGPVLQQPVTEEAGQGVGAARLELPAEDVALAHRPSMSGDEALERVRRARVLRIAPVRAPRAVRVHRGSSHRRRAACSATSFRALFRALAVISQGITPPCPTSPVVGSATGAARAVPVLAVGAAAPAMAASPNRPDLAASSAAAVRGGVTLVLSVANPNPGYAIHQLHDRGRQPPHPHVGHDSPRAGAPSPSTARRTTRATTTRAPTP